MLIHTFLITASQAAGCPQLNAPKNGQVTITPDSGSLIIPGSFAMYTCNTNYQIRGSSVRQCQSSGTWNGTMPTCDTGI